MRQLRPDIWHQQTSLEASRLEKMQQTAGHTTREFQTKAVEDSAPGLVSSDKEAEVVAASPFTPVRARPNQATAQKRQPSNTRLIEASANPPSSINKEVSRVRAQAMKVLREKASQDAGQTERAHGETVTEAPAQESGTVGKISRVRAQARRVLREKAQYDEKENGGPPPSTPHRHVFGTALTPTSTLKVSKVSPGLATPIGSVRPVSNSPPSTLQAPRSRGRPRRALSMLEGSAENPVNLSVAPYLTPPPSKHNGSQRDGRGLNQTFLHAEDERPAKRPRAESFEIHDDDGGHEELLKSPSPKRRRRVL